MKNTLVLNKNYFASRITRIIREKTFGKTYEIGPFTAHDLGIGPHEANFFKGFFLDPQKQLQTFVRVN